MNIFVDMHVFDGKHQGSRTYLKGLYSELIPRAANWNFFLASYDSEKLKKEFGSAPNLNYVQLKQRNKYLRLLIEIPNLLKEKNIDYAHFQYITPLTKTGNFIVTTHDILFEEPQLKHYFPLKYRFINSFLFKKSAKMADLLLTVSQYSKEKIAEIYNLDRKKIHVTPNAVNPKFYNQTKVDENKEILNFNKYLLYVSRIEPRKNHLILLKAFKELQLSEKGYSLVFIGQKDLAIPELDAYIQKHAILEDKSIIWLNDISNDNLERYYRNCELFVFPSHAEGFGIPPLEAMVFGKKVLCSNATAMADFQLPAELTFNPRDVEELKIKLVSLLASDRNYAEVYAPILANYNWKKSASILYDLIEANEK